MQERLEEAGLQVGSNPRGMLAPGQACRPASSPAHTPQAIAAGFKLLMRDVVGAAMPCSSGFVASSLPQPSLTPFEQTHPRPHPTPPHPSHTPVTQPINPPSTPSPSPLPPAERAARHRGAHAPHPRRPGHLVQRAAGAHQRLPPRPHPARALPRPGGVSTTARDCGAANAPACHAVTDAHAALVLIRLWRRVAPVWSTN